MPKGKVYVIDDDEAVRDSLQFLLGSVDFEVRPFESAQAFLDALGSLAFGCVVSDVRMPDIDGIELLRRLKSLGSRVPVIIMTGHGDVPLAVEAMKLGAVDFLEKPFDDDLLISMVWHRKREQDRTQCCPKARSPDPRRAMRRPMRLRARSPRRSQPEPTRAPGDGWAGGRPVQ